MPVYVCIRGDCDNLAYSVEGDPPFVAIDALGRQWLCVNTRLKEIPGSDGSFPEPVGELLRAQAVAHKQGLTSSGSQLSMILARDDDDLRRRLVLDTYPSSGESQQRLQGAGWTLVQSTWRTSVLWLVGLTDGRKSVVIWGRTDKEAWCHAVWKLLGGAPATQENRIMSLPIEGVPFPLCVDESGAARVGDTRVVLDVIVREYQDGADPESIVRDYPTLRLADVYAAIAYYLRNRADVDAYVQARSDAADEAMREIEARQPERAKLREKLLARRAPKEQVHASARN